MTTILSALYCENFSKKLRKLYLIFMYGWGYRGKTHDSFLEQILVRTTDNKSSRNSLSYFEIET
jgi:hypothetical protein